MRSNLERKLTSELPHARAIGNVGRNYHARRGSAIDGAHWISIVNVIQDIERIGTELELHPLGDGECLPNTEVHIEEMWSV